MATAAEFLITLNQQISGPAAAATGALQQLERAAMGAAEAMAKVSAASGAAGGAANGATSKTNEVTSAANKIRTAGKDAAASIAALSATLITLATGPLPSAQQAMTALGQAMGQAMTEGAHKLSQALAMLGPEGAAVGAAIEGLTAAFAATVGVMTTMMGLAIEVSERVNRMRVQFDALAGGAAAGAKVQAMVERLGQTLPFATAQVGQWAKGLLAVGLEGRRLEAAVKGVAAASAVMGSEGGNAAEGFFKRLAEGGTAADTLIKDFQKGGRRAANQLAEMGLRTADVAKAMGMTEAAFKKSHLTASQLGDAVAKALQTKGAGALAAEMNTWPNIIGKAREGFLSLFTGAKTEGFMASVSKLFGLFNKGGAAINVLKPIITSVLGKLFEWGTKAFEAVREGLLQVMIWGVKAYIALFPLIAAFRQSAAAGLLLDGVKTVFKVLAGAILVVVAAFAVVQVVIWAAGAAFIGLGLALWGVIGRIVGFVAGSMGALRAWATGAASAAANFVAGLVQGIAAGAGKVIGAIKGLASSALSAFTGALGIHSPSTIMVKHGDENIAGALAGGVDKGAPRVERAMGKLGGKPGGAEGGAGGGGGGGYFDFRGATFGGDLTEEKLEGWLVRILQRARRSVSEMEPAAGAT